MAYRCDICDKSTQRGRKITEIWGLKYRSIRFRKPNIRKTTFNIDGDNLKVSVCTKCLKLVKDNKLPGVQTIYQSITNSKSTVATSSK